MKTDHIYLYKILPVLLFVFATSFTFSQKPAEQIERKQVISVIDQFFDGINKYDTVLLRNLMSPATFIKHVNVKSDQYYTSFALNDFLKFFTRVKNENWQEYPLDYKLFIEDQMAVAWVGYNDYMDKKLVRCGMNQIDLVKSDKGWIITGITDTQNTGNCKPAEKINITATEQLRFDTLSIHRFIDQWHIAAAQADFPGYFGCLDSLSIYLGTDASERWNKTEFINFSKPYFEKGKAWEFNPTVRNISIDPNGNYVWFDELLSTWMGTCRGSGVLEFINSSWVIRQYNLSLMVPNDKIRDVIKTIENKE